jgi:hypothetical protein
MASVVHHVEVLESLNQPKIDVNTQSVPVDFNEPKMIPPTNKDN